MTPHGNFEACAILTTGELRCFHLSRRRDRVVMLPLGNAGFDTAPFTGATELVVRPASHEEHGSTVEVDAIVGGKVVRGSGVTGKVSVLPSLVDAVQLVDGCALRAQGSVVCWGSNARGALGQYTTIGRVRRPPAPVVGLADVATLALGGTDSWALTTSGTWLHWGEHGAPRPTRIALPPEVGRIDAIAAMRDGAGCALAKGAVWCRSPAGVIERVRERGVRAIIGSRYAAYFLEGDRITSQTYHRDAREETFDAPPGAVAFVPSELYPCVLGSDAAVHCYVEREARWRRIHDTAGTRRASAAGRDGCALLGAGTVTCWQDDSQHGIGKIEAPAIADATDIATSWDHACAVRGTGRITCWHANVPDFTRDMIAGDATAVALGMPDPDPSERGAANVHGCAILRDRTVWCWGSNLGGQLGDGSIAHSDVPLGVRL